MEQEQAHVCVSGQTGCKMSVDPRVARTRANLKQALMQLLEHSDWDGITVAGVCRRAGVARSSFYEHFTTKAELLDEIFADRMSDIRVSARPGDSLGTLDWLADHVAEVPEFFAQAMAGGRGDTLLPRFRAALIRQLEEELAARTISNVGAKAAYLIGGSMAYLTVVKGDGARARLQEMAARVLA